MVDVLEVQGGKANGAHMSDKQELGMKNTETFAEWRERTQKDQAPMSEEKVLTPERVKELRDWCAPISPGVDRKQRQPEHCWGMLTALCDQYLAHDSLAAEAERLRAELAQAQADAERLSAENANNFNQEFFALRDALRDWPKLPPGHVLKWLNGKFPEDWERGKGLQRELGLAVIPPKSECEIGAGLWDRITQGAWRSALADQRGEKA